MPSVQHFLIQMIFHVNKRYQDYQSLIKSFWKKKKKWSSLFPALFIHLSEWVSHRLRHALLSTFLPDAAMTKGFSRVWAISYQRRWLNASPVSIDAVSRSVGVEGSPRHGQRIVYFEECNLLVIHSLIGWNCDELQMKNLSRNVRLVMKVKEGEFFWLDEEGWQKI